MRQDDTGDLNCALPGACAAWDGYDGGGEAGGLFGWGWVLRAPRKGKGGGLVVVDVVGLSLATIVVYIYSDASREGLGTNT